MMELRIIAAKIAMQYFSFEGNLEDGDGLIDNI